VKFMKTCCLVFSVFAVVVNAQDKSVPSPYKNPRLAVEQRVEDLLARMTLEEKADMLSGLGFDLRPNARLGIPAIRMADGPQGVRINFRRPRGGSPGTTNALSVPATAFPCGAALAATWNPDLVQQVGRTIG